MEIRISIFKFLEVLEELHKNFLMKIKNGSDSSKTNQKSYQKIFQDSLNSNVHNNDIYHIDNIFEKEFNNFHLLKNENKQNITSLIDDKSELYYISSNNLTNYDINNRQNTFIELLTKWLADFRKSIQEKFTQFTEKGIVIESNSNTNYKFLNFNNKSEFDQFIRKYGKLSVPIENIVKEKYLYKFFKELYICLKKNKNITISDNFKIETLTEELQDRMTLIFYNIAKRNYDDEDFELHKAVYENNLRMIRKICALEITSHLYCEINELDPNGNTPLMLAIKLKNLDAINVLCDHEADIKHKCFEGDISPIEYAISTKNKEIVKILTNAVKKQKISNWENHKKEVLDLIKNIPDFSMELKLNFDSNIFSLFSSITPSDTYKIFKSGGNLRIDLNISSMNSSFKSIRGKCSIIVQEKGNIINVFKVDHEKKISYDYIDYLGNTNNEDEKVERTLLNGVNSTKIITKNFQYLEEKKKKEEKILNYLTIKHTLKGDVYLNKNTKKKKNINDSEEKVEEDYFFSFKKSGKNFSMYFKEGLLLRKKKSLNDSEKNYNHIESEMGKRRKSANSKTSNYFNIKVSNEDKIPRIFSTKYSNKVDFKLPLEYLENEGKCINQDENLKGINLSPLNHTSDDLLNFKKKQVELSIWISESFPIRISDFIPLIHILSFTSSEFSELKSALCSDFLPFNSFPLKICFPLGLSFYALLSVVGFKHSPSPDSTFDLPYCEKQNSKNLFCDENENKLELDNNYATEFYDRYYLEQKLSNQNGDFDDLDKSTSSNFDRLREMFLTNHDEETAKERNEKNVNFEDNFKDNEEKVENSSNRGLILNDLIPINSNQNKIKVFEIQKFSHPISPVSNTILNINFIDVNFGFFNGELNFENGAVDLGIKEEVRISNGLTENIDKLHNLFNDSSDSLCKMKKKNSTLSALGKSFDEILEDINKDCHISSEKNLNNEKQVVKFPQTPRRLKFNKFNPGQIQINHKENNHSDLNTSQMTIKLDYSPKYSKNFKNFLNNKCKKNQIFQLYESCNLDCSSQHELCIKMKNGNIKNKIEMSLNDNNNTSKILKNQKLSNSNQIEINHSPNNNKIQDSDSKNLTKNKFCKII